ncbi:MAG: hypothetical protein WBF93_13725 [Pirellulales bacterium]|jgi:hypothetical protein
MDPITVVFALFLSAVSAALVYSHLHGWRREKTLEGDEADRAFHRRKFRRRMQASVMIGLTGLAILGSYLLPDDPVVRVVYWALVVLWVVWISLLAMADVVASHFHFARLRREQIVEEARLRSELNRHRHQGNGHASPHGEASMRTSKKK